jgi:hypothetical protein
MGKDGGRRAAWDLFSERQVHMRTGEESRYVVLSRPLQIGVAAGFLAVVALLAIASYTAIAKHVALATQERALQEELALRAAQADQAAGEMAALRQQREAAERENERLSAALDRAEAERMEAVSVSSEAGAKAAELEAALVATTQERRKLAAELAGMATSGAASGPGPVSGSGELEDLRAEATGLRAELARVNREAVALRRTASEARQALRDLQGGDEIPALSQAPSEGPGAAPPWQLATTPAGDAVRRLQQDLADAQATVATLSADLEALKGAGPATDAAAELAALEQQLERAHEQAEQLVRLAARQPEEVDASPDAAAPAADLAPLPSPPAPR